MPAVAVTKTDVNYIGGGEFALADASTTWPDLCSATNRIIIHWNDIRKDQSELYAKGEHRSAAVEPIKRLLDQSPDLQLNNIRNGALQALDFCLLK